MGDDVTRAQVAVDKEHRQLYATYASPCCSGGTKQPLSSQTVMVAIGAEDNSRGASSAQTLQIGNDTKQLTFGLQAEGVEARIE